MKTTLLPYSNNVDSDATCADSSLLSKAVSERSSTHKNVILEKMAAEIQKKKLVAPYFATWYCIHDD